MIGGYLLYTGVVDSGPHAISLVEKLTSRSLGAAGREIVAVTNQWVNSYKRLIPGYEAPVYKCWARNNRSALVRVPLSKRGKGESARIEFRAPDPGCNPYLSFSVMLAAGLKGIDEGYELPPEATDNIYALTDAERLAEGISSLPGSLRDALAVVAGVAKRELRRLGALEVEVQVVLPGEADAAVDLDVLSGHVEEGFRGVRLHQRGYDRDLRRVLGDGRSGVADR